MKNAFLIACALGLSVSGAFACDYQRSAKSEQAAVDRTVVASVSTPASPVTTTETLQTPAVSVEELAE